MICFSYFESKTLIHTSFSDMDATECEKKRVEYIDDLTDLEKQFAILREQ